MFCFNKYFTVIMQQNANLAMVSSTSDHLCQTISLMYQIHSKHLCQVNSGPSNYHVTMSDINVSYRQSFHSVATNRHKHN